MNVPYLVYEVNGLCCKSFSNNFRDGVKTYYVEKDASESDMEFHKDTQMQECEDQSHVHFSLDTSYKVKCEVSNFFSLLCYDTSFLVSKVLGLLKYKVKSIPSLDTLELKSTVL